MEDIIQTKSDRKGIDTMSVIAIVPARYESTRFPGKPLALLCGKPMIQWVYERTASSDCIDELYVATDDERIERCVSGFGGKVIMTSKIHKSGTDRIAEASEILGLSDRDVILNIQGDEPVIETKIVRELAMTVIQSDCPMGTLCEKMISNSDIYDNNVVKVIRNVKGEALYFSRAILPYFRDKDIEKIFYRHVGVYAYRAAFLRIISDLPLSYLEQAEGLEQLRVLENGYKIMVSETKYHSYGIDTPEQLVKLEKRLNREKQRG